MKPTTPDWAPRLESFLTDRTGSAARVVGLRHLTGGASRDTWAVDAEVGPERLALVLRRDLGGVIADDALSREQEFRVLQHAHAGGVLVPRPRWLGTDPSVVGVPFFLMDRLEGESVGRRVVREPALAEARRRLPRQMAEQLARIHALPPTPDLDFLPRPEPGASPAQTALDRAARQLAALGEPHPALELAVRWLRTRSHARHLRQKLREFWQTPGNEGAEVPLRAWYRTTKHANWTNFADVKATYGSAGQVKKSRKVVFDIGGNKFRLVAVIDYERHKVFVRFVLDHKEYDKENWKKDTFGEEPEKDVRRSGGDKDARKGRRRRK